MNFLKSFFFLLVLAIAGCSSVPPSASLASKQYPAWYDNPEIDGFITGVGSAQKNALGDRAFQRTVAISRARNEIAGKLSAQSQKLYEEATKQSTLASSKAAEASEAISRDINNAIREVVNESVKGTNIKEVWTDPADGTMYVLLTLSSQQLKDAIHERNQDAIRAAIARGDKEIATSMSRLDQAIQSLQ